MAAKRVPAGPVTLAYDVQSVELSYHSRRGERSSRATRALAGVSLRVERGDSVTIIGRSGSGKSSLLNLLGGLERPESGTVTCAPDETQSADFHAMSEDDRARFRASYIGFVYQAFHLLPALTAWENVAVPLMFKRVPLRRRRDIAFDLLDELSLPRLAERHPYELSGGEQQRVAIARALANDPKVLLADEPTGNLDSNSAREVLDLLAHVHTTRKVTAIVVTHDPTVAQALAARTIEIADGMIVTRAAGERQ